MSKRQDESTQYHADKIAQSAIRTAELAQLDAHAGKLQTEILDAIQDAEGNPDNLAPSEYIENLWEIQKANAKTRLAIKEARKQEQARRTDHRHAWVREHNTIQREQARN